MKSLIVGLFFCAAGLLFSSAAEDVPVAQDEIVPPNDAWVNKIRSLAPAEASVKPAKPRKVLLYSEATGYQHDVIPHVVEVLKVLAEKTQAFEIVESSDIADFASDSLANYDAVILNNTCSARPERNLFLDVLRSEERFARLSDEKREAIASGLEKDLLSFVRSGKGIVGIHGAINILNNSDDFSRMMGGSFDMHPKRQDLTLIPVEPAHPLLAAFDGQSFSHNDEPYIFKNDYQKMNFRPLLEMDISSLDEQTQEHKKVVGMKRYVAWIKPFGAGRVFYVSPSHQPESYESAKMLQFYLDGIQYALGDLACDDSVVGVKESE
ncbi:ThuA domain-containing protein [Persicirhabdus sediminis]|uniref:ThuA domain-containing protein n=1 Tax=Persicirhabdus sediminis TaxID=454144 RepID=A0A8J7MGW2_9BACT|nr:ThuA domain-containing protein [Persicirhabdus sediminis]MBK1792631.1 ThuA domain-containing protein [Persicirhabdus sediminis]